MKRILPLAALLMAIGSFLLVKIASAPADPPENTAHVGDDGAVKLTGKNTTIAFIGTKPGGMHNGGFKTFDGTIKVADGRISSISVNIDTASLWADDPKLTAHLKTPDFFDAKKYPKATFASTKIEKENVTGDLTLHNVTKSITFPVTLINEKGNFTLTSSFKIDRTDFKMNFGQGKVDNEVTINVTVGKSK